MWPCWAAFAVHSLEISAQRGRSKAALLGGPARWPKLLVCAPVRWNRRIVALRGTGVHLGSGDDGATAAFSAPGWPIPVVHYPATVEQLRGIIVIYIGGLHE